MEAERVGSPFLLYRDDSGAQHIFRLTEPGSHLTIGRSPGNDLRLEWDAMVSGGHAELVRLGEEWTIIDDGLSLTSTEHGSPAVGGYETATSSESGKRRSSTTRPRRASSAAQHSQRACQPLLTSLPPSVAF